MSSYLSPNSERDLRRRASRRRGAREEPALERVVVGAGACRERLASTGRQGYSPGDVLLVMAAHGLPQPLGERHPWLLDL
mmetsp:Transcript_22118/g.66123  ORF Transcript_22118/g.66123 Transcript_22118/m.66123 type:complete len:80 (-) Transcript_22118:73-312(-)